MRAPSLKNQSGRPQRDDGGQAGRQERQTPGHTPRNGGAGPLSTSQPASQPRRASGAPKIFFYIGGTAGDIHEIRKGGFAATLCVQ